MQPLHADARWAGADDALNETRLFTCFVALQDVELADGPTFVFPGTHTREFHARYYGGDGQGVAQRKGVHLTIPVGAAFLMDAHLLHRGGCNTSEDTERALLYITFAGAGPLPAGSTYSLLPEARGLRLSHLSP